ncbi:MAG: pyridoxamine 5'-phosphate oxidase family protein [Rhodobiaceae bacterium]|nr:pyridoxamine 5'-phosphate oxidase family protein [Rhodobiaceae bacterium]
MATIPGSAKKVIAEFPLGFVATVSPQGKPCVSPKGTFLVVEDDAIAFGEIRSPQTIANLTADPHTEVNFVDPFSRKGVRVRGTATLIRRGEDAFEALIGRWSEVWGDLAGRINILVRISADEIKPLTTPPYDEGASEAEMIALYKRKFAEIYP